MQGAQYKLFGKMGLILEQVGSKLGHRQETAGEDVAGETVLIERSGVAVAEEQRKVVTEVLLTLLPLLQTMLVLSVAMMSLLFAPALMLA